MKRGGATLCWLIVVLVAFIGLATPAAYAHAGLPVVIQADEKGPDLYLLRLILPPTVPEYARPALELGGGCSAVHAVDSVEAEHGHGATERPSGSAFSCPGGIGGKELRLAYPTGKPAVPTLVRVSFLSGEVRSLLTQPGEDRFVLPSPESAQQVFRDYLKLGVEHILFGWDHLLFLLCLLILAGTPKRVLLMVTGFTVGHAITITAASLGLAGLPGPPVETAIALSIMILAAEIIRQDRTTLTWRYPVIISLLFGLLHGFGFASALRDIGLPQLELPWALLAFNLGIEAGQLLFLGLCAAAVHTLRRLGRYALPNARWTDPAMLGAGTAWFAGSLSAYWFIDRIPGVFGL